MRRANSLYQVFWETALYQREMEADNYEKYYKMIKGEVTDDKEVNGY